MTPKTSYYDRFNNEQPVLGKLDRIQHCVSSERDNFHCSMYGIYRVSHELRSLLRESVPYVKIYRYNPKHLYPKLNGYGDNSKRSLKVWQLLHTY